MKKLPWYIGGALLILGLLGTIIFIILGDKTIIAVSFLIAIIGIGIIVYLFYHTDWHIKSPWPRDW